MLSGLLNLALLGAALPIGYSGAPSLLHSSLAEIRYCRTTAQRQSVLVRLAAAAPEGEHEYVDDNDSSDESSSAKERTTEFGASMNRSARALFRTKRQVTPRISYGASVPLFYALCTLLI